MGIIIPLLSRSWKNLTLWVLFLTRLGLLVLVVGDQFSEFSSHKPYPLHHHHHHNRQQHDHDYKRGHHNRQHYNPGAYGDKGFVKALGTHFVKEGQAFFVNGFNAYYLTMISADPQNRPIVRDVMRDASDAGLNVGRTWGFNDGGYLALQKSPGVYDESVFQAMDYVLSEAKANGIHLILSLANNYPSMGGKPQYVQWARQSGVYVFSDDAFFYDNTVKSYYKNFIKAILTRVNSITGVAYKDDPTIFAWELMNEPRCLEDASGNILQGWLEEMASFVKSIDKNHMLEAGLEGFYGFSTPSNIAYNPVGLTSHGGSDFLRNNIIPNIDFATVHTYPDQWMPSTRFEERVEFLRRWVTSHLELGRVLKKPVLFAEFGMSGKDPTFTPPRRDAYLSTMYDLVYTSATNGGPAAGAMFWQLFPQSLSEAYGDGYQLVMTQDTSTTSLIKAQSLRLSTLSNINL